MRRDFELVRKLLIAISINPRDVKCPEGYDEQLVKEHIDLLIKAGFIEGEVSRSKQGIEQVFIENLTWNGQDFLDAMLDDNIWQKAKTNVINSTASFTFGILFEWLKNEAKIKLGLP
jgi:hypothetical protein